MQRRLAALVRQSLREAGGRRLRRLLHALADAGRDGDGGHRRGVAARRPCLPPHSAARRSFYLAVASLVVPSILISLGIGLCSADRTWPAWYTSAFGAHLTWTLPFGVLIMFAVFNRFAIYEEAARDLGATLLADLPPCRAADHPAEPDRRRPVRLHAVLRRVRAHSIPSGTFNTLPLEIYGMTTNVTTPVLYALGTVTTACPSW